MKRFVEGVARDQGGLFPAHLNDFIGEDNPVRAVDALVDTLDLRKLGLTAVDPRADTWRHQGQSHFGDRLVLSAAVSSAKARRKGFACLANSVAGSMAPVLALMRSCVSFKPGIVATGRIFKP